MKRKKLLLFLAGVFFIGYAFNTKVNANFESPKFETLSSGIEVTKVVMYKEREKIPNAIWYDGAEGKGYLYEYSRMPIFASGINVVTYKGKVLKGPYIPSREDSNKITK